jgi:Pyruvate/2-oxoacid:ferredoxin oxidoreductase delta subunit
MQSRVSDRGCAKPHEVCLAIAEEEAFFEDHPMRPRVITKAEAREILKRAEEAGLIHMTSNVRKGHWFLCNCCSCCCFQLIAARKGIPGTVNAHYVARIDADKCVQCNTCADSRCQIGAIVKGEAHNEVNGDKCIGCGLCASACPSGAISLIRKPADQQVEPPEDEADWTRVRGEKRGVDYSRFL